MNENIPSDGGPGDIESDEPDPLSEQIQDIFLALFADKLHITIVEVNNLRTDQMLLWEIAREKGLSVEETRLRMEEAGEETIQTLLEERSIHPWQVPFTRQLLWETLEQDFLPLLEAV